MPVIPSVHSLTNFQQHPGELVETVRETRSPLVLTVGGKAEVVVQDAESYRRLVERAEHNETVAALEEGLRAAKEGQVRPVEAALAAFRERHGISG